MNVSSAGKVTNRHLLLWGCLSFSNQKGDSDEVTPQVGMDFVVGLSVGGLGVFFVEGPRSGFDGENILGRGRRDDGDGNGI